MKDKIQQILYIPSPAEDYLSVTVLHGLRSLYGSDVVDWPRYDVAYDDYPESQRSEVYGRGFSVFFELNDSGINRDNIERRISEKRFDLVIISDIWRNFGKFAALRKYLNPTNTIILDGSDSPQVYPNAGYWWRRPWFWNLPKATSGFLYFKREWTLYSRFNIWHRVLAEKYLKKARHYNGLRQISFSIPEKKIVATLPVKKKRFPRHIVDPAVANLVPGSSVTYAFSNEQEYYNDLRESQFGVTMKRAGWDCMRHYEIAGNGAVPCFKDLSFKYEKCAPHGLKTGVNCIAYTSEADLFKQIESLSQKQYDHLASGALEWAHGHSTRRCAEGLVRVFGEFLQSNT